MDKITLNNMIALLDECLINGDNNPYSLVNWFVSERDFIERTLKDAKFYEEENDG
jgi:hypothetical protein